MSELFYAKIIADSIANGIRLTTLECSYPLMIHSQLMTHRMFSRNAQSNRAMPVAKMLEQVKNNPAMPSKWGKNQKGMDDAGEYNEPVKLVTEIYGDEFNLEFAPAQAWELAAQDASEYSVAFSESGYHKQVANRLTMPFQYIKVIVTATEWDNFFKLRLNDADPTMMELARKMKDVMDNSTPKKLKSGEWHMPYLEGYKGRDNILLKCSVARCARVSYNNHDNSSPDIEKDVALANRLLKDGHMSPFEHQATPMEEPIGWECIPGENWSGRRGVTHMDMNGNAWSSNFRGWIQNRNLVG